MSWGSSSGSRRTKSKEESQEEGPWISFVESGNDGRCDDHVSSMSVSLRRAAGGASASHDPRVSARRS